MRRSIISIAAPDSGLPDFCPGKTKSPARVSCNEVMILIARGDNGKWQPAYAGVLGDFASGAISNLYYPASNRNGAGLTIENGFLSVAGTGVGNLLQEFVLKKISSGIKAHGIPQP